VGNVNDACEALAEAVSTIPGLRGKPYVDDQINPNEAQVFNRAFDPRMTLGGSPVRAVALGLRVFVQRQTTRAAQLELREYMEQAGDKSILAAVEDADHWPIGVNYMEVTQIGQPFEVTVPNASYLAVDFDVDVIL
jgi:hypothetical protein